MKADTDVAELDAGVANLKMIDTDDEEEDEEEEESSSDEEGQVVEMSEDEDDAVADTNSLTETSFEGVEYLECECHINNTFFIANFAVHIVVVLCTFHSVDFVCLTHFQ